MRKITVSTMLAFGVGCLGLAAASTTVEVTAQQEAVQVNTQNQEVSQIITPHAGRAASELDS